MKKLIALYAILSIVLIVPMSCDKDNDNNNNTTNPPALTRTEILVKYTWKLDEVLSQIDGVNTRYVRGGTNTTGIQYDNVRATYKADGTGTYTADNNVTYTTTWKFTGSNERNLELTVNYGTPLTYTQNLVTVAEDAYTQSTQMTIGGKVLLQGARYIPQ